MVMRIEKRIHTSVKLYADNGEASTVFFDVVNDDENENTFVDAEICRQRLQLAMSIIEDLEYFMTVSRKSDAITAVFNTLEENNIILE
jgi:hypothetical protein